MEQSDSYSTHKRERDCHINLVEETMAMQHNLTSLDNNENKSNIAPKRRANNEKLKKTKGRNRRTRPASKKVSTANVETETGTNNQDEICNFMASCDEKRPRKDLDEDKFDIESRNYKFSDVKDSIFDDMNGSCSRGHDYHNYSFVIFITTSFQRMYPYSPLFIIWSYDIMMDDQDTEEGQRERQKSCYDNSFTFRKVYARNHLL